MAREDFVLLLLISYGLMTVGKMPIAIRKKGTNLGIKFIRLTFVLVQGDFLAKEMKNWTH